MHFYVDEFFLQKAGVTSSIQAKVKNGMLLILEIPNSIFKSSLCQGINSSYFQASYRRL
jgi:hypothetical protein